MTFLVLGCIYLLAGLMTSYAVHPLLVECCKEKVKELPEIENRPHGETVFIWYAFTMMTLLWPVFWTVAIIVAWRHFTK